jgi:hypothetical protein
MPQGVAAGKHSPALRRDYRNDLNRRQAGKNKARPGVYQYDFI